MKVGIFCTNNYTYPLPEGVIYANQMVAGTLADALAEKVEDVTLFAPEGSKTKARLITFGMKPYSDPEVSSKYPEGSYFYEHIMVAKVFRYAAENNLNIVHAHLRPFSVIPYAALSDQKTILTIHDPLYFPAYKALPLAYEFKNIYYVALSKAHQETKLDMPWVGVVHNGVNLSSWRFEAEEGEYLFFSGRLMPEKGVDIAVRVAMEADLPLKIAGSVYGTDRDFFTKEVRPYLGDKIEYLGSLGPEEVKKLYQGALATLIPITWEEPFGLVMIESMACGTPVIAFRRSSVPEIVVDGKTGYIVKDEREMVEAVGKINRISREECRVHVEKHFSVDRMAEDYLELYKKVVNRKS